MLGNGMRIAGLAVSALLAVLEIGSASASQEDKEQVKANFQSADVNRDNLLDVSEFKTFINLNA